jgi:hypothetical protein
MHARFILLFKKACETIRLFSFPACKVFPPTQLSRSEALDSFQCLIASSGLVRSLCANLLPTRIQFASKRRAADFGIAFALQIHELIDGPAPAGR